MLTRQWFHTPPSTPLTEREVRKESRQRRRSPDDDAMVACARNGETGLERIDRYAALNRIIDDGIPTSAGILIEHDYRRTLGAESGLDLGGDVELRSNAYRCIPSVTDARLTFSMRAASGAMNR